LRRLAGKTASNILSPWKLFDKLGSSQGGIAHLDFTSGGALLQANIPSNQLWVSIKDVLVYEDYEFLDRFRLSKLPSDATVLDAGAYVGLYSLKASRFAGRVVALEPSEQNYRYLESNIRLNDARNVELRRLALSSAAGFSRFSESGTTSGLNEDGLQLAETTTLDGLVEGIGHVDLLKMDIEGAEYEVFGACRSALKRIDKIAAEVHVYNEAHKRGLRRLVDTLGEDGFAVQVLSTPFQSRRYGMAKPWRCALKHYNHGNAVLYRLLLSVIYGAGPAARVLKRSTEIGVEGLLYAYRE
jgi:FkbM family methyltransferase